MTLPDNILEKLRTFILGIFLFSLIGTGTELILLDHMEDTWMWTPLVLMGASLLVVVLYVALRAPWTLQAFRGVMILFVVSGFVGTWMHYKGNAEFELEMYPALAGLELFWESITGATPALAPGAMIQLGLLGLLFTFKHPRLKKRDELQTV